MENKALNDRGFLTGTFIDNYGKECSIQESSACASNGDEGWYIWLGMNNPDIHKGIRHGAGEKIELGEEYDVFSRMHLSQKKVKEMIPHLMYFVETGSLPDPEQHAKFVAHIEEHVQPTIHDFFNGVST